MKKNRIIYLASSILLAGGLLASCSNSNANTKQEQKKEEVQAVQTPIPGINGTKYNAAFFNDLTNKADTASSDKYAVTETGLKYVIVNEGAGKSPKATDMVTVHYVGTLTDGSQFDSSIDRGEPTSFPLNRVIPGWTEGLQLMKEGGVAVFYIPSELGYGEQGSYNPYTGQYTIPPSAPLIFWVQLLDINESEAQ